MFRTECSVFCAIWQSRTPFSQQVNGNAPVFRAIFSVFGDIERIGRIRFWPSLFDSYGTDQAGDGISGIAVSQSGWMSKLKDNKAQIDLVLDRADNIVNLCEIKFASRPYVIDKQDAENYLHYRQG